MKSFTWQAGLLSCALLFGLMPYAPAAPNPYTGTHVTSGGYNPYTGGRTESAGSYNSATGAYHGVSGTTNPYYAQRVVMLSRFRKCLPIPACSLDYCT